MENVSRRKFIALASTAAAGLAFDWSGLEALAARIGPKDKIPVVVAGAGLGGLSAAAVLARQGFPVTLVEQHDRPGGYATSFDRAGGRFTFEVSLHATATSQGGPVKEALEKTGVLDRVQMADLPELCRIKTPDHDLIWPQRDPQAVADLLAGLFPEEKEGINSFFQYILGILEEAMEPFDRDSWSAKMTFPLTHPKMWEVRKKTLAELLDQHVKNPKLKALLASFWGYFGLPPSRLSGFLYAIAVASYLKFGGYYVKNRSQDLSYALMEAVEEAGGKVMLETRVEEILCPKGKVAGVRLAGGETLPARIVVSNASLSATLDLALKSAPNLAKEKKIAAYIKKTKGLIPSISTFLVWLGLNRDIRDRVKGYEIFVDQGFDPEEAYQAAMACDPAKAGFGVTVYDNAFPGYSKPGTSTVAVILPSGYEPWKKFEADYLAGNKEAYNQEKKRIARALIEKTEKLLIPGLSEMIEVLETATPLTNKRFTGNPGGAIYGFEQDLRTTYMNQLGEETPIPGLYLASAWSHGGGYQPTLEAGLMAARRIIKDMGMEFQEKSGQGKPKKSTGSSS